MPLDLLPGLLEESLEHAARAWQRRRSVADNPRFNLRALAVMDESVDRALMSTRFYGEYAQRFLDDQIINGEPELHDTWRFLRLAHSLQVNSPDSVNIAESLADSHPLLVRDAFWHYPMPSSVWLASADHALPLLNTKSVALLRLAIEIVGRVDAKAAKTTLYELVKNETYAADALLALARMGLEHSSHAKTVKAALESPAAEHRDWALRIAVTLGKVEWLKPYESLVERCGENNALAWCAWACLQPRLAADATMKQPDLPAQIRFNVSAITGYVDCVLPLLASIALSDKEAEPYECDLMYLVLGLVPMEATVIPQDREAKSRVLKSLVVRTLREAHVSLENEANKTDRNENWNTDAIVYDIRGQRDIRLREGARLKPGVQAFPKTLADLTHPLRDWIYRERALISCQPLSLSAYDISRRQIDAATLAEMAAEVDAAYVNG